MLPGEPMPRPSARTIGVRAVYAGRGPDTPRLPVRERPPGPVGRAAGLLVPGYSRSTRITSGMAV